MAPLIDIVFLLLIFFIFTAGMVNEPLNVAIELPGSQTAKRDSLPPYMLFISKRGEIYFNDELVSTRSLRSLLAQQVTRQENPQVFIYADRGVDFQTVLRVMDEARLAGVRDINFAARQTDVDN